MDSLTLDTQLGSVQHFLGAYPFDLLPTKPQKAKILTLSSANTPIFQCFNLFLVTLSSVA